MSSSFLNILLNFLVNFLNTDKFLTSSIFDVFESPSTLEFMES